MRAQGDEEIAVALSGLRENTQLLSPAYRAEYRAQSYWHVAEADVRWAPTADLGTKEQDALGFRCSFLVPPVPPQAPKSTRL